MFHSVELQIPASFKSVRSFATASIRPSTSFFASSRVLRNGCKVRWPNAFIFGFFPKTSAVLLIQRPSLSASEFACVTLLPCTRTSAMIVFFAVIFFMSIASLTFDTQR